MITINDWYNNDTICLDLKGLTFEAWRYNRDYTKIYIDTEEGETIEVLTESYTTAPEFEE